MNVFSFFLNVLNCHMMSVNLKEMWRIIKRAINKTGSNSSFPDSFKNGNVKITSPDEISNKFNEYFSTIGPELDEKIGPCQNTTFKSFLKNEVENSFFLLPPSIAEITSIVDQFKSKKSSGWDEVSMSVIKLTINNIAPVLTHICSLSFSQGVVPSEMKLAKVAPIFKCDAKDEFSNYRPISLLSNFSKILEKLMLNRLSEFLDKYNFLCNQQYGFRKKHSTELAVVELANDIAEAIDAKQTTIWIFIDLSKAFDTLNHTILLKKLEHCGVRGIPLIWFTSYLENRMQYVIYNNSISKKCNIVTGVPQGSILGPLLFLIYINDICNASRLLKFILHADDTNIFFSSSSLSELCRTINEEMVRVVQWFRANRLSVNLKKTGYIVFGTPGKIKKLTDCSIYLDGVEIERKFESKFLGIIIDDKLTWKSHIKYIGNKIAKNVGLIGRFRNRFDAYALNTLYNTMVLPYLNYCNVVWCTNKPTRLNVLVVLQKRIIRTINNGSKYDHTLPLFAKSEQLKLVDLNKLSIATFMYRARFNQLPQKFSSYFCTNSSIHSHFTRQSSKLHLHYARTDVMKSQLKVIGPKIWNSIDTTIINTSGHLYTPSKINIKIFSFHNMYSLMYKL